jgi:hypothetical protein
LLLATLALALAQGAVLGQPAACPVQVYYGPGGQDKGDCSNDHDGLCATRDYALQQGLRICPREVQMISEGLLRDTYRTPSAALRRPVDWAIAGAYWLAPWLIGGAVGWWVGRRLSLGRSA